MSKRGRPQSFVLRNLAEVAGPVAAGAAIAGVWLMSLGGSLQLLMAAAALVAASQLLFFLNSDEPPVVKRAVLAYRIVAS